MIIKREIDFDPANLILVLRQNNGTPCLRNFSYALSQFRTLLVLIRIHFSPGMLAMIYRN